MPFWLSRKIDNLIWYCEKNRSFFFLLMKAALYCCKEHYFGHWLLGYVLYSRQYEQSCICFKASRLLHNLVEEKGRLKRAHLTLVMVTLTLFIETNVFVCTSPSNVTHHSNCALSAGHDLKVAKIRSFGAFNLRADQQ